MRRLRTLMVAGVATLAAATFAPGASAHIDVLPTTATAGTAERFTIRVPAEREVDTVEVRVTFPAQILVYSVNPAPGWKMRLERRPDQRTKGVVFTGGRIPANEFREFDVLGTPQETGPALWTSEQVYRDGRVVKWTGPAEKPGDEAEESDPDAPGPGSETLIVAEGETPAAPGAGSAGGGSSDDTAGMWLGAIGIVLGIGALVGVGLLWSNRPARLPDDE